MAWHWKMTRGGKPAGVELSRIKIMPIISTDGDPSEEDIRIPTSLVVKTQYLEQLYYNKPFHSI